MAEFDLFSTLAALTFWLSPVIFVEGVLLILVADKCAVLEKALNKEVGRKEVIQLGLFDRPCNAVEQWLSSNRNLVGVACIVYSLFIFWALRQYNPASGLYAKVVP